MASFLNFCRRLFKTRQHQRFAVQSGTFVIVSPATDPEQERKIQIVDVSLGGAAFIYQGPRADLEDTGFLKMIAETPNSDRMQFQTVSDIPAPGCAETEEPFRRRGVKFMWMGVLGKKELGKFVKEFTICPK